MSSIYCNHGMFDCCWLVPFPPVVDPNDGSASAVPALMPLESGALVALVQSFEGDVALCGTLAKLLAFIPVDNLRPDGRLSMAEDEGWGRVQGFHVPEHDQYSDGCHETVSMEEVRRLRECGVDTYFSGNASCVIRMAVN